MRKKKLFKGIIVLAATASALYATRTFISYRADKNLKTEIQTRDARQAERFLREFKSDTGVVRRLNDDIDIHSALVYYCADKIAAKVAGMKSEDGVELVRPIENGFVVWQADQKKFDTLENVLSMIDPKTKLQMCATFDNKSNDLVLHFGGTDFVNVHDMLTAGTIAWLGQTPRAAAGAEYATIAVAVLRNEHPDIPLENVHASIVAHSQGAAAAPGAKYSLACLNMGVNKTVILAPFGGKRAYDDVAKYADIPSEILEKNTMTIVGKNKGALEFFTQACRPVGQTGICDAEGHRGQHFIRAFNHLRCGQK